MNLNLDIISAMTLTAGAVVPIVVAICQAIKMMNWVNDKYMPFISLGIGILVTFLLADNYREDFSGTILTGILFGLAASGLYSGVKSSAHAIKAEKVKQLEQKDKNKC